MYNNYLNNYSMYRRDMLLEQLEEENPDLLKFLRKKRILSKYLYYCIQQWYTIISPQKIEKLPRGARRNALIDSSYFRFKYACDVLQAFNWSEAEEGIEYWDKIYAESPDYCKLRN